MIGLEHLPAILVVAPLICAPLAVLMMSRGLAWVIATVASTFAFLCAVLLTQQVMGGHTVDYAMGGWPAPYGIALQVDALSAIMLLVVSGASTLALLAGFKSIEQQIQLHRQPLFFGAWLLALSGLLGILVTADAFNVFVFMEISSLASYVLVAGGPNRKALPAVFKYLVMGTIGATFYLIGVGLIYLMTGTLNLADMELRIADVADQRPILVAAGFITIGLALKAAVFPMHVWLPNAYTYAPHAVTAFIAACSTKVAIYVLLRFDFFVFQQNLSGHDVQFGNYLMPLAVAGILVGALVAVRETDLKRLFAWSSVGQIGYIVLAASLVSSAGLTSAVSHLLNHALAKGALFLSVLALTLHYSTTHFTQLAGFGRRHPVIAGCIVVSGLSLVGVPGTAGFISKWLLINALLEKGALGVGLIAVVIVSSLLAVAYLWRIVELAYFSEATHDTEQNSTPLITLIVVILAAGLNIFMGIYPHLTLALANESAQILLGHLQ